MLAPNWTLKSVVRSGKCSKMRVLVWCATKQLGVSQSFINLQAHFSCFVYVFRWLQIKIRVFREKNFFFPFLKLGLLISAFFLTWLNTNKSIQYQGRCLLVKNCMAFLPWKKHLWEISNYNLGDQGFPDSCTVKIVVLPTDAGQGVPGSPFHLMHFFSGPASLCSNPDRAGD